MPRSLPVSANSTLLLNEPLHDHHRLDGEGRIATITTINRIATTTTTTINRIATITTINRIATTTLQDSSRTPSPAEPLPFKRSF